MYAWTLIYLNKGERCEIWLIIPVIYTQLKTGSGSLRRGPYPAFTLLFQAHSSSTSRVLDVPDSMHILNLIGHRQPSWLMENLGLDISVFLSRPFSNRLRNTTVFTAFSSWMHEYITWPHIVTSALEHPISLDKSVVKLIFPGILSSEWKHLDATACMPFGLLLETWGFLQGQGWSGLYFCQFLLTHWRFFVFICFLCGSPSFSWR